jgi:hypothetical protein
VHNIGETTSSNSWDWYWELHLKQVALVDELERLLGLDRGVLREEMDDLISLFELVYEPRRWR